MGNHWGMAKAAGVGVLTGAAIFIFVVGLFNCAGFVLAGLGKAMGCAA